MAHRKNVVIKTKYDSISECIEDCEDLKKTTTARRKSNSSRKKTSTKGVSGKIYADGSFKLIGTNKSNNAFQFVGKLKNREDGLYLIGDIKVKSGYKLYFHAINIFLNALALYMFAIYFKLNNEVIFIFLGILYILLGWALIGVLYWSDGLYKDLIKRFSDEA